MPKWRRKGLLDWTKGKAKALEVAWRGDATGGVCPPSTSCVKDIFSALKGPKTVYYRPMEWLGQGQNVHS